MTASRVFVVNFGGHDLEAAKEHGDLEVLTTGKVNIFATDRLTAELKEKLASFDNSKDSVLLSGAILINVLVVDILKEKFDKVNVLIYNFRNSAYTIRSV